MSKYRIVFAVFILFICRVSFAYLPEEGSITATIGPYIYKTNFDQTNTGAEAPVLTNFALLVNGDLSDKGQLEIGLYHMTKYFFRADHGKFIGEKTQVVHIAMGYRRWLNESISVGLSLYSAYSLGRKAVVHDDFAPAPAPITSASDVTEYGFDASIQGEVWSHKRFAAVINTNYSWTFTNKHHEKADHFGMLLGLRYFIQEKQIIAKPATAL